MSLSRGLSNWPSTLLGRQKGRKVESGGIIGAFYDGKHGGRDCDGDFCRPRASDDDDDVFN